MKNLSLKMISVLVTIFLVSLGSLTVAAESDKPDTEKSILSFEEGDRNKKKTISIDADGGSRPIIDINSQLTIHINKDQVFQEAVKHFDTGASKKVMDAISEIRGILEMEDKLLNLIGLDLIEDDKKARRAKLKFFSENMGKLFDFILETKKTSTKRDAREAMRQAKTPKERYEKVMSIVRRDVDVHFAKLKKNLDESSVVFRLGGWIIHKGKETPIHIEGFDRYEKFQYHQYPFFTKPTTEELVNEIRNLKQEAINYNNGQREFVFDFNVNFKKIFQELKENLDSIFQCLKDSFNQIIEDPDIVDLKDQFPEAEALIEDTRELLSTLDDLKEELDTINDEVNKLKGSPGELENHFLLISSLEDLKQRDLKDDLTKIKTDFENVKDKLKVIITMKPDLKPVIDKILEKIKQDNCIQKIKDIIDKEVGDFKRLLDKIKSIKNSLTTVREQYDLKLGDKVDSLLLDNIPPNGIVDLKFSGPRQEGDEIAFIAVLEKQSADGTEDPKSRTIARQSMMMFKILKLEMNLGLIFANPLTKEADYMDKGITLTKSFQAAPSYSILFKPGSRKSIFYNKYIRFGIGINVSALDFNQDSTYELGLGLVLSGFKDYVQLGFGRNMEIDSWYWFFGLNLPFGEIALPTATTGGASR